MSSDLLAIANSGAMAARAALDVTAQNIANVSTAGYVKRGVTTTELVGGSTTGTVGDVSLFGVGAVGVTRDVDSFRQADARRTSSSAASADTQVTGLTDIQSALEQTGLYTSITGFESSLQQLTSNPGDPSLRAQVLSTAGNMAQTFNLASSQLGQAGQAMQFSAADGVTQINQMATSLAAVNVKISASNDPTAQAGLLDQRDSLLQQMSQYADLNTTIKPDNTVQVQLGGVSGPMLVSGGTTASLGMTTAANGTLSFSVGAAGINPGGGSLAGQQQTLATLATTSASLDTVAAGLITAANAAQAGGVALDGTPGQPLFTGTSAATMGVALTSGDGIATAPAGAAAGSLDPTNLTALQDAVQTADPAGLTNNLLFTVSSAVQNATTTQTTMDAISASAQTSLDAQSGVSLDDEASNLLRYEQAYEASGKVMQAAQTLFTSLLANIT